MRGRAGWFSTPLGSMFAVVDEAGALTRLDFLVDEEPPERRFACELERRDAVPDQDAVRHVAREIGEYFAGHRRVFDVPLAPQGSPFQHRVWDALLRIPFGATRSYGELAASLGRPGSARAVGRANATNPIAVIVPCHRVIGSNGDLTGYAGGLPIKHALLRHEGALPEMRELDLAGV